MNLKQTYNRIAKDYYEDHNRVEIWPREDAEEFAKLFKPDQQILDVGCGPGIKTQIFTDHDLNVLGIDISEKMIEIAERIAPKGKYQVLAMENIGELEETFDGIFAQACLLHAKKDQIFALLKKITAKLKNNGFIYISLKRKHPNGVDEEIKTENDYGYKYSRLFSYYTDEEVEDMLKDLNLKITKNCLGITPTDNWIRIIAQK